MLFEFLASLQFPRWYVFPDSDFLNHAGFAASRSGQGVTLKEVSQRALRSVAPFVTMIRRCAKVIGQEGPCPPPQFAVSLYR